MLSAGIEPALQDPQSCVLSIERREHNLKIPNYRDNKLHAEGQGFEPWEPAKAQQFSRLSHSTALAPLLIGFQISEIGYLTSDY